MILGTLEVHSNWWIDLYTMELFFFKLLYGSESYANLKQKSVKGGYLDFSHLLQSKNIHITEVFMKKKKKKIHQ